MDCTADEWSSCLNFIHPVSLFAIGPGSAVCPEAVTFVELPSIGLLAGSISHVVNTFHDMP